MKPGYHGVPAEIATKAGGTPHPDLNYRLLTQVVRTVAEPGGPDDASTLPSQHRAAIDAMISIEPSDAIEGMIATQMVGIHNMSMECMRRATLDGQTFEGRAMNLNQANKLSRTYATLVEALNRHRGKGQQKVTVEHVHVHEGGQAIVGTVEHAPGGVTQKPNGQAHA